MNVSNVVFACVQVALLVGVCAPMPRLLGLRSPAVQYLFWRVLLAVCLLLPVLEPRAPHVMVFVAAPAGAVLPPPGSAGPAAQQATQAGAAIDWWWIAGTAIVLGIALRLAWIALGVLRLVRMRAGAREAAAGFDDLSRTIGVSAPIRWSRDVTHPVTFGIFRPLVLLPVALKSVDAAAQRAVVAHELHHVKRRDWLWVIAEEVLRSVFWFHPAMWWLISRVQLARETVVDELSILTTNARRTYLDTLLAFADDTGLRSSPAFSARRHLFHRVMLLSKEGSMSSIRIAASAGVLAVALAAGSWGAVQAFPLRAAPQLPPPPPPPPPPGDSASPEGYNRLAAQYHQIAMNDNSITANEKLEMLLKGIAATDRALELKPNYAEAMVWKNVLLRAQARLTVNTVERDRLVDEADRLLREAIALQDSHSAYVSPELATAPPPPPPPPPPSRGVNGGVPGAVPRKVPGGAPTEMAFVPAPMSPAFQEHVNALKPIRIGGGITAPRRVADVRPVYPPLARQAGVQGTVIVEAIIDVDGNVADARILKSIPLLDQAALDAVNEWKFEPPLLNGAPTAVMMTVTVSFTQR